MSKIDDLKKVFGPQLEHFIKDESIYIGYEGVVPKKDCILVRFFTVREEKKSKLIGIDTRTGEYTDEGMRVPTHVGKVIKSSSAEVEVGDIVVFPYHEVAGNEANPKMEAFLEAARTKGATPVRPIDDRLAIDRLEIAHKRKMFVKPTNMVPDEEDLYTYVFFASERQGHYTP